TDTSTESFPRNHLRRPVQVHLEAARVVPFPTNRRSTRGGSVTPPTDHLQSGREFYARRAWADAFDALTLADGATPLESDDLERLAMSAFLIGREMEYTAALERAHHACLDAGLWTRAARSAFWIGLCHLFRGE